MRFRIHRRPSDQDLISWLETGRPSRIERWLDDPGTVEHLERLTDLGSVARGVLDELVKPSADFAARTEAGLKKRVSDLERAGVLFGLLRLGADTARSLPDRSAQRRRSADDDRDV